MPVFIGRITRRAVIAFIKRQKSGGRPCQLRAHINFAIADREMHQSAIGETQQGFGAALSFRTRLAVEAVLIDRIFHRLSKIGFQLRRGHRNAVQKQPQIDGVFVMQGVTQLPHHPQPVSRVVGQNIRIDGQRRFELG